MPQAPVIDEAGDSNRIVPFDSQKHAGLGLNQIALNQFMLTRNAFTISLTEFFYASQHYPVVFLRSDDELIQTSVVTGLRPAENLFVDADGNWSEHSYVPASVRRFPFYSIDTQVDGMERSVVYVDESGLETSQQPYFQASGEAGPDWPGMEKLVADFSAAEKLTQAFSAKLNRLGLLESFEAQVNPKQQNRMHITGMYRVNENRLNQLPAKNIKDLMQKGELSRIYAHLISLENFAKLLDLSAASD
jgi:hypothetical protein